MKQRILIFDDDIDFYSVYKKMLRSKGYSVHFEVSTEITALHKIKEYDLIIMSVMPSSSEGWDALKKYSKVPVLLIAEQCNMEDILHGLNMGADDYVMKPFDDEEFYIRIKRLLRRRSNMKPVPLDEPEEEIFVGRMTIRPSANEVQVGDQWIHCTRKEFALLCSFARRQGKVLSRVELLQTIWGINYKGSVRTIDTHVKDLRRKMEKAGFQDAEIITIWSIGYKFEVYARQDLEGFG